MAAYSSALTWLVVEDSRAGKVARVKICKLWVRQHMDDAADHRPIIDAAWR
jgi:hypothetical protein